MSSLLLNDPILAPIIRSIPPPGVVSTQNVFHDLMSCIIEQQIHYRSTKKIFEKLLKASELDQLRAENFSTFEKQLPTIKHLSSQKMETIQQAHHFFAHNQIDWPQLEDEQVRHLLSSIQGVGKWTIDMILLYTLGRPNVFPSEDYHLKEIMTRLYGLNPQSRLGAQMKSIAEHWGDHQSLGVLYLLQWKKVQLNQL
ncbi:MAG: DNA-3-methyladenine glycosylase family protein [Chitinophagales bacterium]|jgi:DNA-3-methyladenine glycosylase II